MVLLLIWVILIFVGFFGGMIGSLAGLGGGIIIVPALLFLGNSTSLLPPLGPQVVVGTSIILLIVTGLSSTIAYLKQRKVDYASGLIFFIGSGPGTFLGAYLNKNIDSGMFSVIFGLFMIFISVIWFAVKRLKPIQIKKGMERKYVDSMGNETTYYFPYSIAIVISFFVGILSGLFGIGGGTLMIPVMVLLFGFPPSVAVATSMLLVFLSGVTGSIAHIRLGNVEWLFTLALVPGAWFGGKFGSYINNKLNEKTVVLIFRQLMVIIGLQLVFQGI